VPSPVDWLPDKKLVFFMLDLTTKVDLKEIRAECLQKDPHGEKAYDP
jgi:hypothetical protein